MRISDWSSDVCSSDLEAVELSLRQRIGAFLLQRVLRRQHMEGRRQHVRLARHRDAALLHRLQQSRLGARAGAVDLVGHQELAEHRTGNAAKGAAAALALLQHRAEEHTSELQSLMGNSYAVFCLKKNKK